MKKKTRKKSARKSTDEWSLSPSIAFRLSEDLRLAVEKYCQENEIDSASDLCRVALAKYIGQPELAEMRSRGRKWE